MAIVKRIVSQEKEFICRFGIYAIEKLAESEGVDTVEFLGSKFKSFPVRYIVGLYLKANEFECKLKSIDQELTEANVYDWIDSVGGLSSTDVMSPILELLQSFNPNPEASSPDKKKRGQN